MRIYLNTSFLISLYSPDVNSSAAAEAVAAANHVHLVSTLTELEALNALDLRVFRKEISAGQAKSSSRDFEQDLSRRVFQLVRLPDAAFSRARQISREMTARLGTRSADVLHVAAAVELQAERLYSFDHQQRKLARAHRLKVN